MAKKERLQFFFTWIALGVLPLFLRNLWEVDETRYAEIPREMLATGDWLTPKLNYVLYFEKPPFQYWISAIGLKLFGNQAFAARLPLALAMLLTMTAAFLLAKRLGAKRPVWASFMAATSLFGFTSHQYLTLDALFSSLTVMAFTTALEAIIARYEGKPYLSWLLGAFTFTALAVLTKSIAAPVLLGGILLSSLVFAWRNQQLKRIVLSTIFHPLGWAVMLLISAPWFYLVNQAHPGHADFFFINEHFKRFTTHAHARQGSNNPFLDKLYFLPEFFLGPLPWASSCLIGFKRATSFVLRKKGPMGEDFLLHRWLIASTLLAIAVPFLFFSLSGSKLPAYVLPILVPLVALGASLERDDEEPAALKRHGWELIIFGGLLALASFVLPKTGQVPGWLLAPSLAFLLFGLWTLRPVGLTAQRWMFALGAAWCLLVFSAEKAVGKKYSPEHLIRQAPSNAQWISAGNYHYTLPWLTREAAAKVAHTGELEYGRDRLPEAERQKRFVEDPEALNLVADRLLKENPHRPVWALVDSDVWPNLRPSTQARWGVVDQSHDCYLVRYR